MVDSLPQSSKPATGMSLLSAESVVEDLRLQGVAYVIDVGASYAKLADLLGGEVVNFKDGQAIAINPFDAGGKA